MGSGFRAYDLAGAGILCINLCQQTERGKIQSIFLEIFLKNQLFAFAFIASACQVALAQSVTPLIHSGPKQVHPLPEAQRRAIRAQQKEDDRKAAEQRAAENNKEKAQASVSGGVSDTEIQTPRKNSER